MKVKTAFLLTLTLLIISSIIILPGFAQSTPYIQLSLPEGTKARFGKGSVGELTYSPDGSLLAVGTNIGIWLYDTKTYQELAFLAGQMDWISSLSFSPDGKTLAQWRWRYGLRRAFVGRKDWGCESDPHGAYERGQECSVQCLSPHC